MAANENYEPAVNRLSELNALEEENKRSIEKAAAKRAPWKIWSMFGNKRKAVV